MPETALNGALALQNGNWIRELTEEELLALIDESARAGLGISGEAYLQGVRSGEIPRSGGNGYLAHLSMLELLLDD